MKRFIRVILKKSLILLMVNYAKFYYDKTIICFITCLDFNETSPDSAVLPIPNTSLSQSMIYCAIYISLLINS